IPGRKHSRIYRRRSFGTRNPRLAAHYRFQAAGRRDFDDPRARLHRGLHRRADKRDRRAARGGSSRCCCGGSAARGSRGRCSASRRRGRTGCRSRAGWRARRSRSREGGAGEEVVASAGGPAFMSDTPLLIAGLGNPGVEYARNRHNAGFMAVDVIQASYTFAPWRARFRGLVSEGMLARRKTILLKPMTYMNDSGESVAAAVRFYKLPLEALVVVHDEIDLAAGKLKVKTGGGDAGNNGLRSITATLGPDYRRVRLGIGHPGEKDKVSGHVLQNFSKDDVAWLKPLVM